MKLKIPNETQTGRLFRLRGKGVKAIRGKNHGDLFCRIVIETPVHLNREQKDVRTKCENLITKNKTQHNPKATHWFQGVKQFFEDMKS